MEQQELMNIAIAVTNKFGGTDPVKSIIAELNGGVRARIKDLNPSLYEAVAARLNVLLNGTKVAGYAYNSTVAPQGRQPGSYAEFAAPYNKMAEDLKEVKYSPVQDAAPVVPGWISCDERMPDDGESVLAFCKCGDNFSGIYTMRAPVIRSKNSRKDDSAVNHERVTHWMPLPAAPDAVAETDTAAQQFESLANGAVIPDISAAKYYTKDGAFKAFDYKRDLNSVIGAIDSREKAQAEVERLQKQWDLLDDNELLRALMDKMEERHGEEFNAFFEATVRQIMIGSGMTELRINTAEVLKTLVESRPMRVTEVPGFLVYELVEDNDANLH